MKQSTMIFYSFAYSVRITSQHNIVANTIVIESLECPVAVRLVAVPGIIIKWIFIAIYDRLVNFREDLSILVQSNFLKCPRLTY